MRILRFILQLKSFYWVVLRNYNLLRTGGKYWTEYLSSESIFRLMRVWNFWGFVFMMITQLKLDMAPNVYYLKLHATKHCFCFFFFFFVIWFLVCKEKCNNKFWRRLRNIHKEITIMANAFSFFLLVVFFLSAIRTMNNITILCIAQYQYARCAYAAAFFIVIVVVGPTWKQWAHFMFNIKMLCRTKHECEKKDQTASLFSSAMD